MKLIRWPVVSLILFALLIGFFITDYLSNSKIRNDFEYYSSEALNTIVKVGTLNLKIFRSSLRLENILVIDPVNKSRFAFRAKSIVLRADVSKFFERRMFLQEAKIHDSYIKLTQTKKGKFTFLSERAYNMAEYEPTVIKINRILTWTADHLNPVKIVSPIKKRIIENQNITNKNSSFKINTLRNNSTTQLVFRGYKLKLPRDYPDFLVKTLSIANCNIDLYPYAIKSPIKLRNIHGKIFELSSRPKKHPKPVTLLANGFVGDKSNGWFNVSARIDAYAGRTNIIIDFAVSNIFLPEFLSLVNPYTPYAKILDIESGQLTARGRFQIRKGKIVPSSVYCRLDNFTAQAVGELVGQEWLNSLSISNTFLEAVIPINNKKPYFHFETAFEKENFRTTIHNFQLKFKPSDLGDDLLDGVL
ncbi:MAG: hypothetical protein DRI44_01705 [Chlamydiae bacterium]|nr:MAG: hypothetical protein DRI44_01705 [Chlamydiota bacterium]